MKISDKQIYQIHTWLGLIGGIFILFISITGTLLVFAPEIDVLLNSDLVEVKPVGNRKNLDSLISSLKAQQPDTKVFSAILHTNQPTKALRLQARKNDESYWVYVNPYSGKVIGERPSESAFPRLTKELHENLLIGFTGRMVMGLVGICLLLSVLTGIWYYRKSLLEPFRIGVRFGKKTRIVHGDLHKFLGVSALLFLLVMSGTGIFFHWEVLERAMDSEAKKPEPKIEIAEMPANYSIEDYLQKARAEVKGFVPEIVNLPRKASDVLQIRGNRPESVRIFGKFNTAIDFDLQTGQQVKVFHAEDADEEYKMEHIFEEIHFAQYGGWFTKIIHGLGGIALGVMVITGLLIWLKRK